jgi:WD40 repeat protein
MNKLNRFTTALTIFALVVLFSFSAVGQHFNIVIQKGHLAPVKQMAFHENNRLLASSDERNDVIVWDVSQGKEIIRFKDTFEIKSIDFLEHENILITANERGQIKYYNVATGDLESKIEFGKEIRQIVHFGDQLLVVSDALYLVNFEEGVVVEMSATYFENIAFNYETFEFIGYNYSRELIALDTNFNQTKFGELTSSKAFNFLSGSSKNEKVRSGIVKITPWSNSFFFTRDGDVIKTELFTGKNHFKRSTHIHPNCLDVEYNGEKFVIGDTLGNVHLFNEKGKKTNSVSIQKAKINSVKFSYDNRYFAAASNDNSVVIYSAIDGKVVHDLRNNALPIYAIDYDKKSNKLYIAQDQGTSGVISLGTNVDIPQITHHNDHIGVVSDIKSKDNRYYTVGFDNQIHQYNNFNDRLLKSSPKNNRAKDIKREHSYNSEFIYSLESNFLGNELLIIQGKEVNETIIQKTLILDTTSLNIKSAKEVPFFGIPKEFRYYGSNYSFIEQFNYDSWGLKKEVTWQGINSVMLTTENKLGYFDIKDNEVVLSENYHAFNQPINAAYNVNNEQFFFGLEKTLYGVSKNDEEEAFREIDLHQDVITDLTNSNEFLFSSSLDGSVKVWDLLTEELVATIIPFSDKSMLIYTPDMYYLSVNSAHQNVGFKINADYIPFENFDLKLNRPDIVLSRLKIFEQATIDLIKKSRERRLRKFGFSQEKLDQSFQVPELNITNLKEIPLIVQKPHQKIAISTNDETKIDRINIWINGVPNFGEEGYSCQKDDSKTVSKEFEIQLSPGKNEIEISSFNENGNESLRKKIELFYDVEEASRDLYLVTIGVNDFNEKKYNLNYAEKDANDISAYFNDKDFNQVHHIPLMGKDFNKESLGQLKKTLEQAKITDQIVLFIATHGVIDENYDYFFATSSIDFQSPKQNGVSKTELMATLNNIPCRNKIVFMDACHSGEIDKEEIAMNETSTYEEGIIFRAAGLNIKYNNQSAAKVADLEKMLFEDLRKGNGSTVIGSSSGVQLSLESQTLGNGLFTAALLEVLKNQPNKSIDDLYKAVTSKIEKESNGMQTPSLNAVNRKSKYKL